MQEKQENVVRKYRDKEIIKLLPEQSRSGQNSKRFVLWKVSSVTPSITGNIGTTEKPMRRSFATAQLFPESGLQIPSQAVELR